MADLQTLINAIPTAQDGNVITSDYHNTMRAAVAALASQPSATPTAQDVTMTVAPVFWSDDPDMAWTLHFGVAEATRLGKAAWGWMPIQLPNGVQIKQMTVRGTKSGFIGSFSISLGRQDRDQDVETIVQISPPLTPAPFNETRQASGAATIVDTSKYKYWIQAQLFGPSGVTSARIYDIQIVYGS